MSEDAEFEALNRLMEAVVRQNDVAARLVPEAGPRDPRNLALLPELYAAQADARAATEELRAMGAL